MVPEGHGAVLTVKGEGCPGGSHHPVVSSRALWEGSTSGEEAEASDKSLPSCL